MASSLATLSSRQFQLAFYILFESDLKKVKLHQQS